MPICGANKPRLFIGLFLLLAILWRSPVESHRLSVFAWVEGKTVRVEGILPRGRHPKNGWVLVYDGNDQLILRQPLKTDGTATFPLPDWQSGLKIVMDIGEGHQNYWILTPQDIQKQIQSTGEDPLRQPGKGTANGEN